MITPWFIITQAQLDWGGESRLEKKKYTKKREVMVLP